MTKSFNISAQNGAYGDGAVTSELCTLSRHQVGYDERGVASSDKGKLRQAAQKAFSSSAHIGAFGNRAVSRVLCTLSRHQEGYDKRGIALCDRGKLHRAAQEI